MAQFWGGKNKHKKKAEPNFEFVSPYPLEDCVWQLQNFPGVDEKFPIKTQVKVLQVDREKWEFEIIKTYYSKDFLRKPGRKSSILFNQQFAIKANGYLHNTGSNQTLVIGKVDITKNSRIYISFLIITLLGIMLLSFLAYNLPKQSYLLGILIVGLFFLGAQLLNLLFSNNRRFVPILKSHLMRVLGR